MMKKTHFIFLLFLIANLIPHVYVAVRPDQSLLNWYLTDDAFYYFKVAQNISEGQGITFDGIAPTNGFHPLWMLICIPVFYLARWDLFFPLRILLIVQALFNAGSGYFLFRLFHDHGSTKAGWIAAVLWMFLPAIHGVTTKLGLETGLNAFALLFLIHCVAKLRQSEINGTRQKKVVFWVSLSAILVLFSRLDNIFFLIFLGCWLTFRNSNMRWITQVDFLLILVGAVSSYFLRIQSTSNIFNFLPFAYLLLGFALAIKPTCLYFFGLYEFNGKTNLTRFLLKTVVAVSLASLLIGIAFYILHDVLHAFRGISRAVLILDWLISTILLLLFRLILYRRYHQELGEEKNCLKKNWRTWMGNAFAYFLPLLTALSGYMLWNKSYCGSMMPVSGQIKRWWGLLPNTVYGRPIKTLAGVMNSVFSAEGESSPYWLLTRPLHQLSKWLGKFLDIRPDSFADSYLVVVIWLIFLTSIFVLISRRWRTIKKLSEQYALLPLFVGFFFHTISYKTTGYLHAKFWYWVGEMIFVFIFFGIILAAILDESRKKKAVALIVKGAVFVGCLMIWVNFAFTLLQAFPMNKTAPTLYDYQADFQVLEKYTEAGDVIGMTGGGISSYFMPDRTFINLDGLINSPAYFETMKMGNAQDYLRNAGMQFVYGEEQVLLDSDPYRWYFTNRLDLIHSSSFFNLYRFCADTCR